MKKRLLTLLIVFTMVFITAVPAFAATDARQNGLMMTGLGDSVASGCTNVDFLWDGGAGASVDGEFRDFVKFTNGEKVYDCDAVKLSFVSKLYRAIGANKYSKNLAFPGLRAKDFCNIVGLKPLREGDYEDGWYQTMIWACQMNHLENEYNSQMYKNAISHSDVIAIELGENDLSSCMLNNYEKIYELFGKLATMMPQGSTEQALAEDLAVQTAELNDEITGKGETCVIESIIEKINKDIEQLIVLGKGIEEIVSGLMDILSEMTLQNRYYFKSMMSYIAKNSKPGAVIVVGSMINPLKDMADDTGLVQIMNLVIGPFINDANAYMHSLATKYGYTVADITSVSLNPGDPYMLHPDEKGQQIICDQFSKIINKKLTDCRMSKLGVEAELTGVKEATYFEAGYTGDEVCKDCGALLLKGKTIAKLRPNATKIKNLSKGSKSFTVKWAKASKVNGYQVQYSTSSAFKNAKKVTVSSKTATCKKINNLKSGKKYYVRVRTYKNVKNDAGKTVKAYSKWSAKKSVKTK